MKVIEFEIPGGKLTLCGGPSGWNMTRTIRGSPPRVEIIDVSEPEALDLVEAAIRGDVRAAAALFWMPMDEDD